MSLTSILLFIGVVNILIDIAVLYVIYRKENPNMCERCKHLKRKGGGIYRYECLRYGSRFDRAPKICSEWEEKKK